MNYDDEIYGLSQIEGELYRMREKIEGLCHESKYARGMRDAYDKAIIVLRSRIRRLEKKQI